MTAELTQPERVLRHIETHGSIHQGITLRWDDPITRLAARIQDLQDAGHPVDAIGKAGKFTVYGFIDPRKPGAAPRPANRPKCPHCGFTLESLTDTLAANIVRGRCITHGWQVVVR